MYELRTKSLVYGLLLGLCSAPALAQSVQGSAGGAASVDLSRGSLAYSIPLPALPERNGFGPTLSLDYAQSTRDQGGGFGIGWSLPGSSISVNFEVGTALKGFSVAAGYWNPLMLDGQRIKPLGLDPKDRTVLRYQLEADRGVAIIRLRTTVKTVKYRWNQGEEASMTFKNSFEVVQADGTRRYYSGDVGTAETHPTDASQIMRWPLVLEINPVGEAIVHTYQVSGQRSYLTRVEFAGGQSVYEFDLIDTRAKDRNFYPGFPQWSDKLYGSVKASFSGQVLYTYCFAYRSRDERDQSMILAGDSCKEEAQVLTEGHDAASGVAQDTLLRIYRSAESNEALPRLDLYYTSGRTLDQNTGAVFAVQSVSGLIGNPDMFQLMDADADGKIDIALTMNGKTSIFAAGHTTQDEAVEPYEFQLANQSVDLNNGQYFFADVTGDGWDELIKLLNSSLEIYERKANGGFALIEEVPLPDGSGLHAGLLGGQARFYDMDRDGRAEILTNDSRNLRVFGLEADRNGKRMLKEVIFPYPSVMVGFDLAKPAYRIEDLNADGLLDLIHIRKERGGLCLYENTGLYLSKVLNRPGSSTSLLFSSADRQTEDDRTQCDKGRFVAIKDWPESINASDMMFIDANDDGYTDLLTLNIKGQKLQVWFGNGTGGLQENSQDMELNILPSAGMTAGSRMKVADIDGDGRDELVLIQGKDSTHPVLMIDFNRLPAPAAQLLPPGLLTAVKESTGHQDSFGYTISSLELDRDSGVSKTLVRDSFPVVKILQSGYFSPNSPVQITTEEYSYHGPTYDRISRSFQSFRSAERWTYGKRGKDAAEQLQGGLLEQQLFYTTADGPAYHVLGGELKASYVFALTDDSADAKVLGSDYLGVLEKDSLLDRRSVVPSAFDKTPLQSQELAWNIKSLTTSTFRLQQDHSIQTEFNSAGQRAGREVTIHRSFQSLNNLPGTVIKVLGAVAKDSGHFVPANGTRVTSSFEGDDAASLQAHDIYDRVLAQQTFSLDLAETDNLLASDGQVLVDRLIELADGKLLSDQKLSYDTRTGQLLRRESTAYSSLDHVIIPAELAKDFVERASVEAMKYNELGNLEKVYLNNRLLNDISYDKDGIFVQQQQNALGHTTSQFYGRNCPETGTSVAPHLPACSISATGKVTHFQYDAMYRLVLSRETNGVTEIRSYKVDPANGLSKILTTRQGSEFRAPKMRQLLILDSEEQVIASGPVDADDKVHFDSISVYDNERLLLARGVPKPGQDIRLDDLWNSTHSEFLQERSERSSSFRYDSMGREIVWQDSRGTRTEWQHEPWGTLTRVTFVDEDGQTSETEAWVVQRGQAVYAKSDAEGHIMLMERDARGFLKSMSLAPGGNPREFAHDAEGHMLLQTVKGIGNFYFVYDDFGNLVKEQRTNDKGVVKQTLIREYDLLNRIEKITVDGVTLKTYSYDRYTADQLKLKPKVALAQPLGQMTAATGTSMGTATLAERIMFYDQDLRTVKDLVSIDGNSYEETSTYAADDRLLDRVNGLGHALHFDYTTDGRLKAVRLKADWMQGSGTQIISDVDYRDFEDIYSFGMSDSQLQRTLDYDRDTGDLQAAKMSRGAGEFLQNMEFDWNGKGSLQAIRDQLSATGGRHSRSAVFGYNARQELISAQRYDQNWNFEYMPNGIRKTEASAVMGNDEVPPQFKQAGYKVNDRGEVVESPAFKAAVYNSFGQIESLTVKDRRHEYAYDAFGRRVAAYEFSLDGKRLASTYYPFTDVEVGADVRSTTITFQDSKIAEVDDMAEKALYFVTDQLGSVEQVLEADGRVVAEYYYGPYGEDPFAAVASQPVDSPSTPGSTEPLPPDESERDLWNLPLDLSLEKRLP